MKPIFGVDITQNRKNTKITGTEFMSASVSASAQANFDSQKDEIDQISSKGKLPKWVLGIALALYIYGFFAIMMILRASEDVEFAKIFDKVPWLIISGVLCLALGGIIHFISKKKEEKVSMENNLGYKYDTLSRQMNKMFSELGVPVDAKDVDVLVFCYKMKKGQPRAAVTSPFSGAMTPFNNISLKMYAKDGSLCIADYESVYSFSLYELLSIKTVSKRIAVPNWNKNETYNKGIYKKYKITRDNRYGLTYFKPYHILEIERMGEKYGLYFPCYELPAIEELTGIKADEKPSKSTL